MIGQSSVNIDEAIDIKTVQMEFERKLPDDSNPAIKVNK